jgi:PAS domain S-box-containing protein
MRLSAKLVAFFLPVGVAGAALLLFLIQGAVRDVVQQGETRSAAALLGELVPEAARGLAAADEYLLLPLLQDARSRLGALYALALDAEGRVIAHTNVVERGKLYDDPATRRQIAAELPVAETRSFNGEPALDVSFPVHEDRTDDGFFALGEPGRGRRVGTLRVGLPLARSAATEAEITARAARIILAIAAVLAAAGFFFTRPILLAVRRVAQAADRVARGERGVTVPVVSRDELGDMASSFNTMSRTLNETTVSRDLLQESEERHRAVVDSAAAAIVASDSQGKILSWNKGAEAIFGYAASEISGRPLSLLMPEKYRAAHEAGLKRLAETGRSQVVGKTLELEGLRKNGEAFPLELSLGFWRARGQIFFTGVMRDVTARRRAEEGLKISEERFRLTVQNVKEYAIFMLDPEGRLANWNPGVERVYGYTAEEIVGRHFSAFYPEEDLKAGKPAKELEVVAEQGRYEEEGWRVRKDGTRFWANVIVTAVRDEKGRLLGFAKVTRDMTEKRRIEQKLLAQSEELARSNKDLEQFAYVASHDLQEPLRMVASYVQLLERRYRDKLNDDAVEFIRHAVEGVVRMKALINDLLTYSRAGAGREPEPVDAGAALNEALANLQSAVAESGAEVKAGALPVVLVDPTQLVQLFQNLVGNALKFRGRERPRVEIGAVRRGAVWELSVKDNGIGIAAEHRERIFVIFQRLHARGEYPGTGIGLALCKRIVERHGGRLWLESEPGRGSTFFFTLPAAPGAARKR